MNPFVHFVVNHDGPMHKCASVFDGVSAQKNIWAVRVRMVLMRPILAIIFSASNLPQTENSLHFSVD